MSAGSIYKLLQKYAYLMLCWNITLGTLQPVFANEDHNWPLHGFDVSETRFSPLAQINSSNINELGFAWSFEDFHIRGRTHRGNQATPLMIDGVLYFSGPWSVLYAVDARTGKLLWEYNPEVPGQWARKACCDVVSRGVAYKDGVIFLGTSHGFLDAVDAVTGKRLWRTDTLIDRSKGYTITGAPRLAGDRIVIGNGGAELGVRGYFSAYDTATGELLWRFYTVPGAPDQPDEHPEVTIARPTWSEQSKWSFGLGGTVWDSMVYDPELDWMYVGVGNGSPWPQWDRSPGGGDNLFLTSILAIDTKTGRMQWHYQTTPGDSWDFTATQHMILASIPIKGKERKVLMQAPKNGFFYVLDRLTGELLSAEPYTHTTWASSIDMTTGRPVLNTAAQYKEEPTVVRPSIAGAHNWQPMAYSLETGLAYIPVLEMQQEFRSAPRETPWPDSINANVRVDDTPDRNPDNWMYDKPLDRVPQSVLKAFDPKTGKIAWESLPQPWWSGGLLATAGNLIFQGGMRGALEAYDAQTGRLLYRHPTGTAIMAAPITYMLDGVQYIAVLAGFGGSVKAYPKDSAPHDYENYERLLVFRLGGTNTPLPPDAAKQELAELHSQTAFDLKLAYTGRELFLDHCARCHSYRGVPNNYPNLWNMSPDMYDQLDHILLGGTLSYAGMPAFDDVLSGADIKAIREFLLQDEFKARSAMENQPH